MRGIILLLIAGILVLNVSCRVTRFESYITDTLWEADSLFSVYSATHGMKAAFLKYAHEDAVMLRDNSYPIVGIEELTKYFENHDPGEVQLTWKPIHARISEETDMGYTYGLYTLTTQKDTSRGSYVTIWKRELDGEWKFLLDAGNQGLGK